MNTQSGFNVESIHEYLMTVGVAVATNVALAGLILIVGFLIAGSVSRWVRKMGERSERLDNTLSAFFGSIVKWAILAVVFIAVLNRFGVETTSMVAALGAVTLAIGFALQGTLSNVAAGVMIVFFRPYKLGDYIEVANTSGTVRDITLFYTELNTPQNVQITVPNGQAWGGVIMNYSAYPTRRCDFTFSASYDDDIEKVRKVIRDVFEADDRVMDDPAFFVEVGAHGASSIDYTVRAWCKQADFWSLHFDMNRQIKEAFDKNGIEIPYPHQVEIHKEG